MPLHKTRMFLRLIGLFALAATGCQSADPAPPARTQSTADTPRSACQKADAMWNAQIIPSRYVQLPPLAGVGFSDFFTLARSSFSVKALTTEGDELEQGRRKLVHAFGVEARLRWVLTPEATTYSGIFQSGAECIIGRFSMANKPTTETSIPALALKIFIDGNLSSLNLHLMHSVDGQTGHNFFAQTFSNILPPAQSFSTRLLDRLFRNAAEIFGAKDPNPGRLTLEHLASTLPEGTRIATPKTPYQLLFKPTPSARALMQNVSAADDFRLELTKLQVGQAIYDIYALAEGEPATSATLLGQLVLTAPVVSSRYGDEKLYFRHNMEK